MTFRLVPFPLGAPLAWPTQRTGGFPAQLLPACRVSAGGEKLLDRLRQPGAIVVTTGQQPSLFTGPLFTIYKAISAAALAAQLERRWNVPVVPLFWVAGDDHDFAEASHASWLTSDGKVSTARLPERAPDAPLTPLYKEPLGAEVEAALQMLSADLAPSEYRDQTLQWLSSHFRRDAMLGAAFTDALAELITPLGVVCFDSTHPTVKRAAAAQLLGALAHASELDRQLAAESARLVAAGRDPGVPVGDGATLVMLEGRLGRDRLVQDGDGFVTRRSGERFDRAALEQIANVSPERLSPNVLLRPVVESALLPTVAYVGGPSELRYLALSAPVFRRLEVPPQLQLPRWSGILVETRVDRVLEKFGATLEELIQPGGALEARVLRSQLPEGATVALARLRAEITAEYARLGKAAVAIDPTLEKPVLNTRNQALGGTQDIEKRLLQHLKKRQETELNQIVRARASVEPGGKPQERVLTVAPFLARYGPGLLETLREEFAGWYASGLEAAAERS